MKKGGPGGVLRHRNRPEFLTCFAALSMVRTRRERYPLRQATRALTPEEGHHAEAEEAEARRAGEGNWDDM